MTMTKRYAVDYINSLGRIVRTRDFSEDQYEEAVAVEQRDRYREPSARGRTIIVFRDGGESEQPGLHR